MASANMSREDPFLTQIERIRVGLREKVARAHQMLQERETALLSELQQLEDNYRGEEVTEQILELSRMKEHAIATFKNIGNKDFLERTVAQADARMRELEANLKTARDKMRPVELEWDRKLEGILSKTGSIREEVGPNNPSSTSIECNPTRGLKNLGNTCFMNSILQCLSHTLLLRQFYVSDEYRQCLNNRGDLSCAFKRVIVELWSTTSSDSVAPYALKREVGIAIPMFSNYRQHDAHELMRFLLNELHEEINRASVEGRKSPADNETLGEACARYLTWENSRISELFSGMLRSEVCCSVCRNKSNTYIPFMDIALPIPEMKKTAHRLFFYSSCPTTQLTECLKMFTIKETLDGQERPYCNKCRKLTTSSKQLFVCNLPKFLIIQLKRFSYYPKRTKLSTPVMFNDTWRLKDSSNNITHTYFLYGIVCHSGSLYGGHYVAYCKYNGIWRCFNDSMVRIVSWEQVKHQEAYVLFYTEE